MYSEKHWRDLMDLGIVHFMAYPVIKDEDPDLILETARKIALDDFFNVIEVRRSQHPQVIQGLKEIAQTSNISIGVGAQPPLLLGKLNINSLDDAERQAAVDDVKRSIDAAYELGARICAFLSGPDPEDESKRADAMAALVDSCVELCEYSKSKAGDGDPVWLSLEQFDDKIDKKCLIGPSPRAAELAERVKEQVDNFGLTQDLSHLPLLGESPQEALTPTVDHLIHVHVGNAIVQEGAEGYGDKHPGFGYPGSANGVEELARFLEALIYVGYFDRDDLPTRKPVVTFEVAPIAGEDSDLLIAGTKRAFHAAWSML